MKIKVDIDNVIRDMGANMVNLYNSACGDMMDTPSTKEDIFDYDVEKAFPLLAERGINARDFFFRDNFQVVYTFARPMKDAIKGLKKLRDLGHEIFIVSYQPSFSAREKTLKWLEKYKVPYDAVVFTSLPSKTIIAADVIIDDNPTFLDQEPSETIRVCVDWAYNRDSACDCRVGSILDYANILENTDSI